MGKQFLGLTWRNEDESLPPKNLVLNVVELRRIEMQMRFVSPISHKEQSTELAPAFSGFSFAEGFTDGRRLNELQEILVREMLDAHFDRVRIGPNVIR